MNLSKRIRMLGFVGIVVAISVATNLMTSYITNRNNVGMGEKVYAIPSAYAKFASASRAMETDFTVAAGLSIHAVVHVKTKTPMRQSQFNGLQNDPFFEYFFGHPQQNQSKEAPMQEASGSGVIISRDGYIVTNNHVVDQATDIEVTLNDKRAFKAKIVGTDPNTDIALLKIEAEDLPVIVFGNSDSLKVGEWVLAVGNPFNLTSTVTAGIVSAKARNINILDGTMKIESFIQTDAAINPGNSGGALVNTRGELIGINTAIASQTGTYAGYAFAVPVSIVQKVVYDIRKFGVTQRAVLGVQISDINSQLAKEKNLKSLDGAYVGKVSDKGSAMSAGVKEGDVITVVNGVNVTSVAELQEQIGKYRPGDKITLGIVRNNIPAKLNVELKNRSGNFAAVSLQSSVEVLGATFKDVNSKLKNQLQLDNGVQIESLAKGKLLEQGLKPGFIIVKVNNILVKSSQDIQAAVDIAMNNGEQEKVLFIAGVYPDGKVTYYAVNLAG